MVMDKTIDFRGFPKYDFLLPPANEVWGKVIFSVACVKNSVHGGGTWAGTPPARYTPPIQVHSPGSYPRTPQEQCMLEDTGNKWAVCILLECILVLILVYLLISCRLMDLFA